MTEPPARDQFTLGPEIRGRDFRVRQVDYGSGYRHGPHAHDWTGITLIVAGSLRETAYGREEEASALSVVVKPAGTVHANVAGSRGARALAVEILDAKTLLGDDGELGPWRWLHAGAGVEFLLGLQRTLAGRECEIDPRERVLELLAEVGEVAAPRTGDAPFWVRQAREALDDLAPEGIRVQDLAEKLGVHPVSLTRAFRRAYGVPVTTYRRRVRLRRAAAEVVGSERSLSDIAHVAGYADHSHMCREIRDATGMTPSDLREAAG